MEAYQTLEKTLLLDCYHYFNLLIMFIVCLLNHCLSIVVFLYSPGNSGTKFIFIVSLLHFFVLFTIWESGLDSGDHFSLFGIAAWIRGRFFALFGTAARRAEIMVSSCGTVLWIQETRRAWFLVTWAGISCAKKFVRSSSAMLRAAG